MKAKIRVTRIEDDEQLTELLSKRKKYQEEYQLNVIYQGHLTLQSMIMLTPFAFNLAIASLGMWVAKRSLRECGMLK